MAAVAADPSFVFSSAFALLPTPPPDVAQEIALLQMRHQELRQQNVILSSRIANRIGAHNMSMSTEAMSAPFVAQVRAPAWTPQSSAQHDLVAQLRLLLECLEGEYLDHEVESESEQRESHERQLFLLSQGQWEETEGPAAEYVPMPARLLVNLAHNPLTHQLAQTGAHSDWSYPITTVPDARRIESQRITHVGHFTDLAGMITLLLEGFDAPSEDFEQHRALLQNWERMRQTVATVADPEPRSRKAFAVAARAA